MLDKPSGRVDTTAMCNAAPLEDQDLVSEEVNGIMTDTNHPVTVAVRELRRALGLKQEDFAKVSGVPISIISQIEAGKKVNPSWETLRRLVVNVGLHPSKLFPVPPDKRIGEA